MKKLLISLATIALATGSVANATAFSHMNHNQQKTSPSGGQSSKPTQGWGTTNEDVEDIANKLFNKVIKIDPNFWLAKDIKTNQAQFNAALVKQGLLTQDEVQYVTWANFKITKAGYFWNVAKFTIQKDGATAIGQNTINASIGETPAQIAAKLSNTTLQFNYDWWNGKDLKDNWAQIPQIIMNENRLTKAETSVVTGLASDKTISGAGKFTVQMHVNDNNVDVIANVPINATNDGLSAAEIADQLQKDGQMGEAGRWSVNNVYFLQETMCGKYADDPAVVQNFKNILNYERSSVLSPSDVATISMPHQMLTNAPNGNNLSVTTTKDGQTATANLDIVSYNSPYVIAEGLDDLADSSDFEFAINLTPAMINYLCDYFDTDYGTLDRLGYFYQVLDDGDFDTKLVDLPYEHAEFVPWWNRLETYMHGYGSTGASVSSVAGDQSDPDSAGDLGFVGALEDHLYDYRGGTKDLTVDVGWHYEYHISDLGEYSTTNWGFW